MLENYTDIQFVSPTIPIDGCFVVLRSWSLSSLDARCIGLFVLPGCSKGRSDLGNGQRLEEHDY
jgi:hypothetical protein